MKKKHSYILTQTMHWLTDCIVLYIVCILYTGRDVLREIDAANMAAMTGDAEDPNRPLYNVLH
jgi:hypothetical protein